MFNKGTKKAILAMRQTNLATVVKADFQYAHELTSGSKGSGSLRCVVADGMSSFPLTASYAFQAVALLDANEVSVISITMVVNDRQLGHAVPCSIGKLVNCVTKFAADRSLDARVVDSRSYSSRGKLARDGMFWSLFLLAPKTLGADRIASIHDSSKHAAKASMAAIRSPLSHRSLKLPDIIRSGFAWQVVSTLFRLDNSKFGIPLSTASLPVDVERELDASVVSDRFMIFDGARVKNLRSEAVGKGDFIVDVCIVSREEILAARRVQPEAIPTKQQWFGTKAFPEHSTCKDGLNARLDYERFELQRSASCVEKTLSGYRSLGESDFSGHYVLVTAIRHSPKIMNFLASNAAAAPAQGLSPSDGVRLHDKGGADAEVDAGARAPSRVSVVLLSDDSSEPSDDEDVIVGYTLDVDAAASEYGQSAGFLKPSADDDARLDGVGASDCRPGSDHRIAGAKRAAEGPLLRPLSDPYLAEAAEGRGMSVGSDDIRTHPSSGLGDTVSDLGAVAGADVASFPGFHVSAEKAVPTLALHRSCCDFHDPGGDHPLRGYTKKRRHDGLPEPWCSDAIYDSMLRRDLVGVKAAIAAGVCTEGNFSVRFFEGNVCSCQSLASFLQHGTTHLITAAAANLFDFVNVLIDAGANVCAMNSVSHNLMQPFSVDSTVRSIPHTWQWGNTALFHAVLNGNLSMVKVLLNARANVFTVNLVRGNEARAADVVACIVIALVCDDVLGGCIRNERRSHGTAIIPRNNLSLPSE